MEVEVFGGGGGGGAGVWEEVVEEVGYRRSWWRIWCWEEVVDGAGGGGGGGWEEVVVKEVVEEVMHGVYMVHSAIRNTRLSS